MWDVELVADVEQWYLGLVGSDPVTAALIEQAIDRLADDGPMLGRPLVDRIKQSGHHNMKELAASVDRSKRGADLVRLRSAPRSGPAGGRRQGRAVEQLV